MSETIEDFWSWLDERLGEAVSGLIHFAGQIVWAILIIILAAFIVRRFRQRVYRALSKRNIKNNVPELITNVITIGAYILAGLVALRALGADSSSLVTSISLITAAVSLSLQDVLKNFVSGLYLLAEQPFAPGDRIRVAGEEGIVERVDIRTTQLRNDRAEQVLVPNSKVFSEVVGNRSAFRLNLIVIQIAGAPPPPREAASALLAAVADLPGLAGTPPRIEVVKAAPDGVDLRVTLFFAADPGSTHDLVAVLHDRFPEASVTIGT